MVCKIRRTINIHNPTIYCHFILKHLVYFIVNQYCKTQTKMQISKIRKGRYSQQCTMNSKVDVYVLQNMTYSDRCKKTSPFNTAAVSQTAKNKKGNALNCHWISSACTAIRNCEECNATCFFRCSKWIQNGYGHPIPGAVSGSAQ